MFKAKWMAVAIGMVLFVFSAVCPTLAADQKVVKVCIDTEFPPFTWLEKGEVKGLDWELWQYIAEVEGLKIEPIFVPWPQSLVSVEKGQADVQAGGVCFTCKRSERLDFTRPYWKQDQVVLVRKDSDLNGVTALCCGAKVGAMLGTAYTWLEEEVVAKGIDIKLQAYDVTDLGMKDLENGRIDAMYTDGPTARSFLEKGRNVKMVAMGFNYEYVAFAITKGDPKNLVPIIEKALKNLYESGKWAELIHKYMPWSSIEAVPMAIDYKELCAQ